MRLIATLSLLTSLAVSVISSPVEGALQAQQVSRNDAESEGDSCGMITFKSRVGTPLLNDQQCHKFVQQEDLKHYNILNGCTCFFFNDGGCSSRGGWTGWRGPNKGDTTRTGLHAYMCRPTKPSDGSTEFEGSSTVDARAEQRESAGSLWYYPNGLISLYKSDYCTVLGVHAQRVDHLRAYAHTTCSFWKDSFCNEHVLDCMNPNDNKLDCGGPQPGVVIHAYNCRST